MIVAHRLLLTLAVLTLVVAGCSDGDSEETATTDQTSVSTTTPTTDQTSTPETATTDTSATSTEASATSTETTVADSSTTTSEVDTTCSASGIERPGAQPELPAAVADRRDAILTAALACDLDALAALTGPSFTASFGGGDPKDVWTADEDFGSEPMRALVEILRLAPTSTDGDGGVFYVWPPAFNYDTWEEVPEADREALRVLYDDADFEGFAQFGGYIGYRTVITEDGTWTAFVAGD